MNIQKIYDKVKEDEMNSPLYSVILELEQQGYNIKLEGLEVTAGDLADDLFEDLEKATNEFEIELLKYSESEQRFKLVFTGYHQFSFQQINK